MAIIPLHMYLSLPDLRRQISINVCDFTIPLFALSHQGASTRIKLARGWTCGSFNYQSPRHILLIPWGLGLHASTIQSCDSVFADEKQRLKALAALNPLSQPVALCHHSTQYVRRILYLAISLIVRRQATVVTWLRRKFELGYYELDLDLDNQEISVL